MKHVDVSQVAGGEHFTIVLDSTRTKLYGFGRTCSGQLGYTEDQPEAGSFSEKPVQIYLEYDTNGKPIENPVIEDQEKEEESNIDDPTSAENPQEAEEQGHKKSRR